VVYNTGEGSTDVYAGTNHASVAATSSAGNIVLTGATKFPAPSPGNRFHLVANRTDVFACADGKLYRFSTTGIPSSRPGNCPAIPADAPVFADGVSTCSFVYQAADGLVLLALGLTAEGETLTLQHEIHVDNHP
jgi:MSHA biogenesis protein MshO